MSAKRGESAFPRRGATIGNGAYDMGELGMTLRDYFAAAALQGWLSTAPTVDKEPSTEVWTTHDVWQRWRLCTPTPC